MPRFEIEQGGKRYEVEAPDMQAATSALGGMSQQGATPTQQPEKPSSFLDFFKSIPRGIVGGAMGAASALGQAEGGQQGMENIPGGDEATRHVEQNVTGKMHEPQTPAGKFGAAVGGAIGNPATYVGPGGIARSMASGIGGAVGGEAGGQLTGGSLGGQIAGGLLGGGLTGGGLTKQSPKTLAAGAPTREELFDAANAAYKTLKDKKVPLPTSDVADLATDMRSRLNAESFYMEDQPRTFRAVDRLLKGVDENVTSSEVYAVRTALNRVIKDKHLHPSDAEAATHAIEQLDEFLSHIPGFAETAAVARGNWRAAKTSARIAGETERGQLNAAASGVGANIDNSLRQRIKAMYLDKKVHKTPEEAELMRQIATGGQLTNIARLVSRLGPSHPLSGWGSAIAADVAGGGGLGTASLGIGALAKHIAERGTKGKIEKLDEMVRGASPLAGKREPLRVTVHPDRTKPAVGTARGGLEALSNRDRDKKSPALYE